MFPNCSHSLDKWRFFHPTPAKMHWRKRAEKSSVQQLHPSQPNSRQPVLIRFLIPVPGVQVSPGVLYQRTLFHRERPSAARLFRSCFRSTTLPIRWPIRPRQPDACNRAIPYVRQCVYDEHHSHASAGQPPHSYDIAFHKSIC